MYSLNILLQQLLKGQSKIKRFLSADKILDDEDDQSTSPSLVVQNKKQSASVNVNYRDESGSTALMLAALNGHRDVVYTLIQYSAEVFTMDGQGYVIPSQAEPLAT